MSCYDIAYYIISHYITLIEILEGPRSIKDASRLANSLRSAEICVCCLRYCLFVLFDCVHLCCIICCLRSAETAMTKSPTPNRRM